MTIKIHVKSKGINMTIKIHEITSLNIETTHKECKDTMKAGDQQGKYHLEILTVLKVRNP